MRKNPHDKILKKEPKEQHLSIALKFCSFFKVFVSLLNLFKLEDAFH